MNNLTVIERNGIYVVDSREVAEMIGKRHSDLLESISGYIQHLENGNFRSQDFFIRSAYKTEGNNKNYECFLLTKKGCDMVANKMTGEKGVLFTAAYVTKFEEMETQMTKPASLEDLIIMQAQSVKDLKLKVLQIESSITQNADKTEVLEKRINNLIDIDISQPKKDILNKYVQRYGIEHCKSNFAEAWKHFDNAFYYATGMYVHIRAKNAKQSRPLWLETNGYLDTEIRVADNMLNKED